MERLNLYRTSYNTTANDTEKPSSNSFDKLLSGIFVSEETVARINRLKELEKIRKQGYGELPPRISVGSVRSSKTVRSFSLSASQDGLNGLSSSGVGSSDRYGLNSRDNSSDHGLNRGYGSILLDRSTGARQKNYSTSSTYQSRSTYSDDKENRYKFRKGSASSVIPDETLDNYTPFLQRSQSLNTVTNSYDDVESYQSQYNNGTDSTLRTETSFDDDDNIEDFKRSLYGNIDALNKTTDSYNSFQGFSSLQPFEFNTQSVPFSSSFSNDTTEYISYLGKRPFGSSAPPTTRSLHKPEERASYNLRFDNSFNNGGVSRNEHYLRTTYSSENFLDHDKNDIRNDPVSQSYETKARSKAISIEDCLGTTVSYDETTESADCRQLDNDDKGEDAQEEEDVPSEEIDEALVKEEEKTTDDNKEQTVEDQAINHASNSEDYNNVVDNETVDKASDNEDMSSQISNSGSYDEAPLASELQNEDSQSQVSDPQTSDRETQQQTTSGVTEENTDQSEKKTSPPQSPSKLRSFFGAIFHPFDRSPTKKEKSKKEKISSENKDTNESESKKEKTAPVSSEGKEYLSASDYETASDEDKEEEVAEECIITTPGISEEAQNSNKEDIEKEKERIIESVSDDLPGVNRVTFVETIKRSESYQINESVQKPLEVSNHNEPENLVNSNSAWIENNISPKSRSKKICTGIATETESKEFQESKIGQTQTFTESSSSTSVFVQTLPVKVDKATQTDEVSPVMCTEIGVQASCVKVDFCSQVNTELTSKSLNVTMETQHTGVKSPVIESSESNLVLKGNEQNITKPFMIVDLSAKKRQGSCDDEHLIDKKGEETESHQKDEEVGTDNDENHVDDVSLLMAEPYKTAHENAKPKFITPIMEVKSPKHNGSPFNSSTEFTFSIGGTANADVKANAKTRWKRPPALLPKSKNSSNGRRTPTSPTPTTTSSRSSSLSSVDLSPVVSPGSTRSRKSETTYDDQGREIVQDPIRCLKDNPFIRNDSKVRKVTYGSFSKRCEESMGKSRTTPPTTPRGSSSRKDCSTENGKDSKSSKSSPLSPRVKPQVTTRIVNKIISSAEKVQSKVTGLTSKSDQDNSTNEEAVNGTPQEQDAMDLTPNHLDDIFEYADADEPLNSDKNAQLSVNKSEVSDGSSRASSPRDINEDKKPSKGKKGSPTKKSSEKNGIKSPRAKSPFPENLRKSPVSVDSKRRNSAKSSPVKDDKAKPSSSDGKIVRPCNREENTSTTEGKKVPPPKAPKPKKGTFAFLRGKKS